MRSPLFVAIALAFAALLITAVAVKVFGPDGAASNPNASPTATVREPPWEVTVGPGGAASVFGLRLPGTRLGDLQARWGEHLQVAVIVPGEGPSSLEALVERFTAAGMTGRLALAFSADPAVLEALVQATPGTPTGTGARRHALGGSRLEGLATASLTGVSFLPTARIEAETVQQRFGEPGERRRQADGVEHWLYADRGLSLAGDAKGRQVLQYVAPADFDRLLRQPLVARPQVTEPSSAPSR